MLGKNFFSNCVMDGILTSQARDTPVVTSDVDVLINSCLHYLLWEEIPLLGDSLPVASLHSQLTTDNEDPLCHHSYLMPDISLSFHPYLVQITFEYLEYVYGCTEWYTKFDSVFIGFHTV
jgi:hypothetical protein